MFDDLLAANARYIETFTDGGMSGKAAKKLAVVTCIDTRIEPLAMVGIQPGDAKIIRNAGARVSDDVLRSLILATNLLDVERICVVRHTECAVGGHTDAQLKGMIAEATGIDTGGREFLASPTPADALAGDVDRIRSCVSIPEGVVTAGFVYDVRTGELRVEVPA